MGIFSEPQSYTRSILWRLLPKYCHGKVIDVGAGRGKYSEMIKKYAESYLATDNKSSKPQFGKSDGNIDIVCDATKIPVSDNEFDTVVCTEVLEHVSNPFDLVRELSRILKKDGHLIISSGWIAPYHKEPKDYYRFSEDAYRYLCKTNRLSVEKVVYKGRYFTLMWYLVTRTIKLHLPRLHRTIYRFKLRRLIYAISNFCFFLDRKFPTKDTIGHVVVAIKK